VALPSTVPYLGIAWDDLIFLALAAVMLGSALLVVLGRNIIRSGLWMILSFAALAGIYVLLGAPLVAGAQVLVYIGAISVLILFAIMLTQSKAGPARLVFHHQAWAAAVLALFLVVIISVVVFATPWAVAPNGPVFATSTAIAHLIFNSYVLPFEVVSILLLAAVIGGVFLAKREDDVEAEGRLDLTNPPADPPLPVARQYGSPTATVSNAVGRDPEASLAEGTQATGGAQRPRWDPTASRAALPQAAAEET
jgi:NADH-quinone oxidoreductase subunit J